jgi:hypothetical protein
MSRIYLAAEQTAPLPLGRGEGPGEGEKMRKGRETRNEPPGSSAGMMIRLARQLSHGLPVPDEVH